MPFLRSPLYTLLCKSKRLFQTDMVYVASELHKLAFASKTLHVILSFTLITVLSIPGAIIAAVVSKTLKTGLFMSVRRETNTVHRHI